MRKILLGLLAIVGILSSCTSPARRVASPDGSVSLAFNLNKKGGMNYEVAVNNQPFILPSALGFEEQSGLNLADNFEVKGVDFDTH